MKLINKRKKLKVDKEFLEYLNPLTHSKDVVLKNKNIINIAKGYKKDLKKNITNSELKFKLFLVQNKIKHEFQKIIFITRNGEIIRFFIGDFYISKKRLIVEIDGGYHNTIEQKEKDKTREFYLTNLGYSILRLNNSEVNEEQLILILKNLK